MNTNDNATVPVDDAADEAAIAFEEKLRDEHPDWDDERIIEAIIAFEANGNTPVDATVQAETEKTKLPEKPKTVDDFVKPMADAVKTIALEFSATARKYLNRKNSGREFFELGALEHRWQEAAHADCSTRNVTYSRKNVGAAVKEVARLSDVPDSLNLPHEFSATFWLAALVTSTPPENPGDLREFKEVEPAQFFKGNMTYAVIRKLFPTVDRKASDDDLDSWEFNPGWEAWTRGVVKQLQSGLLSAAMVAEKYAEKKSALSREAREARESGLSKEARDELRAMDHAETREKKIRKVREDGLTLARDAMKSLGMSKGEFRDLMVDCQAIPAEPRINAASIDGIARILTPADAKLLIQTLADQAIKGDERSAACLKSINESHEQFVTRLRNMSAARQASTSNPTIPLKKTGT